MIIRIKILKEVLFDLTFMYRDNENTFYYFGFHFLFFRFYLWKWDDICNFTLSVYLGIPFTPLTKLYEKYFND